MGPQIIQKITIKRLIHDVKYIINNPLTDNNIYYSHDETDMMIGYALIIGPSDTPYQNGYYLFKFNFPNDYPFSPPKVTFHTNGNNVRFNPNLYVTGKVCLSVLNTWHGEKWSACNNIRSVLLSICSILVNNPLLNEPEVSLNHSEMNMYTKAITFNNILIAILAIVNKSTGIYNSNYNVFYPTICSHFMDNYQKNREFILEKIKTEPEEIILNNMYHFNTYIDYNELLKKLEITHLTITKMNSSKIKDTIDSENPNTSKSIQKTNS